MHRTNLAFSVSVIAMLITPAFAQMARPNPSEMFAQADTNHDGRVSRDEFLAARHARFDKLDRNHDGYLSNDDIPAFMRSNKDLMQKFDTMLTLADANHDGKVSREEFIAAGMKMFDLADADHDGYVDKSEMQQAMARMKSMGQ